MKVVCYDIEIEIPDIMIDKYIKDFDTLPGSGQYESICQLRGAIWEVIDIVADDPDIIEEPEYLTDFIKALAMKKAMETHGIYLDS